MLPLGAKLFFLYVTLITRGNEIWHRNNCKMRPEAYASLRWSYCRLYSMRVVDKLCHRAPTHHWPLLLTWISNYIHYHVWDETTYPFLNINSATTVETLYSTIYYSKYFIELNFDKSTQYVALWTHKRHPIPRPFGRAMECLLWVLQQKLTVL